MKKILLCILLIISLSGCMAKWKYEKPYKKYDTVGNYTINVKTFLDERSPDSPNDTVKVGGIFLGLVPLVPFANISRVNRPEGTTIRMENMAVVLPQETALELESSGMFKKVSIDDKTNTDYTLKGTILKTTTEKYASFGGLSLIGVIPELIGFPAGMVRNCMSIKFELIDRKGKTILSKVYKWESWKMFWIYRTFSKAASRHQSTLYKKINNDLVNDIKVVIIRSK